MSKKDNENENAYEDVADDIINGNNIFTDENFPTIILNKIWSYLIDEAPFDDSITLTCKNFRNITYNHPSHASRFHFRLEPLFKLNDIERNHNKFQIGAALTPATKRAIIVPSVKDAITDNTNVTFAFKQLKGMYPNNDISKQWIQTHVLYNCY